MQCEEWWALNGLVFCFLYFVQCGAFAEYITFCLKLKVEEDGTQFIDYLQEGIAISGFLLCGFVCLVCLLLLHKLGFLVCLFVCCLVFCFCFLFYH